MKNYGLVHGSEEQAKPLVIGKETVYVHTNIQPVMDEDNNVKEYTYEEVQYDKDEFIALLSIKLADAEQQVVELQQTMCDLYEGMRL